MPKLLQTVQYFWVNSSLFALEKYFKNLVFLREKLPRVFGKYVAEQDIFMPNLLQSLNCFDRTSPH